MADDVKAEKAQGLESTLKGKIADGDVFLVQGVGEDVRVSPLPPVKDKDTRSPLARSHPDVYGRALGLNERISSADDWYTWPLIAAGVVACIALHMGALDGVVPHAESLRGGWVYGGVMILFVMVAIGLSNVVEAGAYRRSRDEILDAVAETKLAPGAFVAEIEGDPGPSTALTAAGALPRKAHVRG